MTLALWWQFATSASQEFLISDVLSIWKKSQDYFCMCNLTKRHIRQEFQQGSDYLTSRVGRKVIVKSLI